MKKLLRKRREELGLTQQQAADYIGMKKSTYGNYEEKYISRSTKNAQKIIKSGFLGTVEESEVRRQLEEEARRERSKHRITHIPDFYERLNALCDEKGAINVSKNDPRMQELRMAVGGSKVMTSGRREEEWE